MGTEASVLTAIVKYATVLEKQWCKDFKLDWSEAEELVTMINAIGGLMGRLPSEMREVFSGISDYAATHIEWDSGEVADWPLRIIASAKAASIEV